MTLSDAKIRAAKRGGLQARGKECKEEGSEGTQHVEGMAGSSAWLECQVHGTGIF